MLDLRMHMTVCSTRRMRSTAVRTRVYERYSLMAEDYKFYCSDGGVPLHWLSTMSLT